MLVQKKNPLVKFTEPEPGKYTEPGILEGSGVRHSSDNIIPQNNGNKYVKIAMYGPDKEVLYNSFILNGQKDKPVNLASNKLKNEAPKINSLKKTKSKDPRNKSQTPETGTSMNSTKSLTLEEVYSATPVAVLDRDSVSPTSLPSKVTSEE